ncbi:MAG: VWA domain-containing protein [Blastocatellia bacterium]|nr:VWA domain-containing protein [Blastocatellia bacterium]
MGSVLRTTFVTALLLVFLCAAAMGQSGRVQPTPTPEPDDTPVTIDTEEVKINVIAFDMEGQFVRDVAGEDLVIAENNILHQPTSVRRIPAHVLIMMDTGGELRSVKSLSHTRETARALVANLRLENPVAVLQYGDTAEIVAEWTTDRNEAIAAINRTNFGRRSVFVQALELARSFLMNDQVENRHLVLISDGTDSTNDRTERRAALQRILGTDINVHVLSYTRMEATDIEPRTKSITNAPVPKAMPDEVVAQLPQGVRDQRQAPKIGPTISVDRKHLERMRNRKADLEASELDLIYIAESSNGTIIVPESTDEMIEKTATVARMIDSSYLITYTPKIPLREQSGTRNIEVTSRREGLIIHANRKLIVAPSR